MRAQLESDFDTTAWPRNEPEAGLWPGLIGHLPKPFLVLPMTLHWFWMAARYRSLTLPSSADPAIAVGGLVGESKIAYYDLIAAGQRRWHAATAPVVAGPDAAADADRAMQRLGLAFPLIAKPDIGWCGYGVRRLDDRAALDGYIAAYPAGETLLLQEFLDCPGEAGLYYVRWPGEGRGRVLSLTVREPPRVMGDGVSTLRHLIENDARLRSRLPLFAQAGVDLDRVAASAEAVVLSAVWSHRMGGLYRNRSAAITPALEERIDAVANSIPDFHIGRLDIRFASLAALARGEDFKIMEINGAGSEAIEFFDPDLPFFAAYRGILKKQAMLFALAARNRARGHAPCGWRALARAYVHQWRLVDRYPASN